ncbi:MAG: hypothetical protein BWY85_01587 [Firmicutes bacterium ADurb.Bin506]|nr:MAG: hypothetical protein BWY85_01587 [Firmicutes bacterium ADurb.Bin506]
MQDGASEVSERAPTLSAPVALHPFALAIADNPSTVAVRAGESLRHDSVADLTYIQLSPSKAPGMPLPISNLRCRQCGDSLTWRRWRAAMWPYSGADD